MSGEATGYVWRESPYTGATFIVHLAIADVVNDLHDNEFWMALKPLAAKARVGRTTTVRALTQLVTDGYLIKLTDGHAQGQAVRYSFEMDASKRDTTTGPRRYHHESGEVPPRDLPLLLTKENETDTVRFDEFYDETYPRKMHRGTALKAFKKAIKAGVDPDVILDGARRFRDDPNLPTGDEAEFIPLPSSWLNAEGWADGPLPPRRPRKRRAGQVTEDSIRAALDRNEASR